MPNRAWIDSDILSTALLDSISLSSLSPVSFFSLKFVPQFDYERRFGRIDREIERRTSRWAAEGASTSDQLLRGRFPKMISPFSFKPEIKKFKPSKNESIQSRQVFRVGHITARIMCSLGSPKPGPLTCSPTSKVKERKPKRRTSAQ